MDWNDTDGEGSRVQLAVIKLSARVPVIDERYGGMIWLQDGGPGLSGVDLLLKNGRSFQKVVDSDLDPSSDTFDQSKTPLPMPKYFDIFAIDSRGLNNSTPCFSCFPTLASRQSWARDSAAEGIVGSSDVSFHTLWARMQAVGKGCPHKVVNDRGDGDKLALHSNTTPQIADMVKIIELHGQWREREARRQLNGAVGPHSEIEILEVRERTRWRENEERLNFWGFSYGTVIGATFAAMHPHRVGHTVLDGVVDTEDYYLGRRLTALFDTDYVLERLAQNCYVAGAGRCALHRDDGAPEILQRLRTLIQSLRKNPVGVPGTPSSGPQLISYSDVVGALFNALYAPIQEFPTLASRLNDLSNGNGTAFAAFKQTQEQIQQRHCDLLPNRTVDGVQAYAAEQCRIQRQSPGDTRAAIICTDSNTTYGMTRSDFATYIETLQQQSPLFAEMFAQVRMKCVAWDSKPKWRFPGPFAGNPARPMLMAGTLADPVTPIRK